MKFLIIFGVIALVYTGKKIYDISGVNNEYDDLFIKFGSQNGVKPEHLKALSLNESWLGKFKNKVTVNGNTTGGLMHLELPTARDYAKNITPEQLLIPEIEIEIAAKHFKWLLNQVNNDIELAVRAYNGGIGRVRQYIAGVAPMGWIENTNNYWERFNRNLQKIGV